MNKIFDSFPISLFLSVVIVALAWFYANDFPDLPASNTNQVKTDSAVVLPVRWGDLGVQLIEAGVIDKTKMESLYESRGEFGEDYAKLLTGEDNENLKITAENSGYILNLLWALGLANKNPILEEGPMMDTRYNGAGNFASTGGWTLAEGDSMNHYSKHTFLTLSGEQQNLVEEVSKNIYRPCCNNSTYFPDCNHGMAMLGLLELLASQNVGEEEMYRIALEVNSLWFPSHYNNIGAYLEAENIEPSTLSAKDILGMNYSSGSAAGKIATRLKPQQSSGGSCGV